MKFLTIVPAYGRDYKSMKALMLDWDGNKDFQIMDKSSRWNGSYVNKEQIDDLKKEGVCFLNVRYNRYMKMGSITIQ